MLMPVTTVDNLAVLRLCKTLDGRTERLSIIKRGGRRAVSLSPAWSDGGPGRTEANSWLDDPRYYVNLTATERRTWRQILSGVSLSAIADTEGVSRAAIYERIQGNRFGHGGMIGKNVWVLLWWRLRKRLF
jgi:hypothetical protein